ncbi:MAG: DUF885 domain-containing protein [Candidatus Coatesbacteria bacterium]|nr:DUF885 domain-containing protein [Candidatus Coatesbacteria bacterium]
MGKKMINVLLYLFLLSLIGKYHDSHVTAHQIMDDYFKEYIELNPDFALYNSIGANMGNKPLRNDFTDYSIENLDRIYALARKYREKIRKVDMKKASKDQRINAEIFKYFLDLQIEEEKYRYHSYILNHILSPHNELVTIMTEKVRIETVQDAEGYIERLDKFKKRFDQIIHLLEIQKKRKFIPSKPVCEIIRKEVDRFVSVDPSLNILYTSLEEKMEKTTIDEETRKMILLKASQAIRESVYPSFNKYSNEIKEIEKSTDENLGVWKLKNGENFYKFCLKNHTSTKLSEEVIHNIGLKEVARIQLEITKIVKHLGLQEGLTFPETMKIYWKHVNGLYGKDYFYDNDEGSKTEVVKDYQAIIKDAEKKLPDLFSILPRTKVIVLPVPEYKEGTAGTYYQRPSFDRKTEGIFYANTASFPFKPGMNTLTYHEAIPGHHLQLALQNESEKVHITRSLTFFTAYIEGWALYAEKLAYENGWLKTDYEKISYLNSELIRAVRLVVDTGIHYKRWNFAEASRYMIENLGWSSPYEIYRYSVWPGQACAYKIGELKITELKEMAKKKLGSNFNIKEFHSAILMNGSMPLDLLEDIVREYIKNKKSDIKEKQNG